MLYLDGRMSISKTAFNERNIYFDQMQFDNLDFGGIKSYAQNTLFQTVRYYLAYIQQIADKLKEEYVIHALFPTYLSGGTNVFVYKFNEQSKPTTVKINNSDVSLFEGHVKLNKGTYKIELPPNYTIVDLFNTQIIKQAFSNFYTNRSSQQQIIDVHVPDSAVFYIFQQNPGLLSLNTNISGYVVNYHYGFDSQYNQIVKSDNFIAPIVIIEPIGGVEI